jgi:hypothetical protein
VSNVLNEEKKQQVIALERLGWSLRRIPRNTGVRRETAAIYLTGPDGFRLTSIRRRAINAWHRDIWVPDQPLQVQ